MAEYTEDDLVNAIIEDEDDEDVEFFPEAHYNHYGDRGVVDVVEYDHPYHTVRLREVKSEAAVRRNETGANSILRQYNRMRKYFFEDDSWDFIYEKVTRTRKIAYVSFRIEFIPTRATLQHLVDNQEMYLQAVKNDVFDPNEWMYEFDTTRTIMLRHPEQPGQGHFLYSKNGKRKQIEHLVESLEELGVDTEPLNGF